MRDLYQILGLGRAATGQDIQRAYRRKAKAAHPDTGGSVEAFSELSTAYKVLSDPHRRQRYDSTELASLAAQLAAIRKLRKRIKRKANGRDNLLARVLDWHEASSRDQIKKGEASVSSMERALEILKDYSFAEELGTAVTEAEVADALNGALEALDQLATALKTGPVFADLEAARPSPSG